MLASLINADDRTLDLVEDSGIQFLDKEFELGSGIEFKKYDHGYALLSNENEPLRLLQRDASDRLCLGDDSSAVFDEDDPRLVCVDTVDTLAIYNGVWFPIPFYRDGSSLNYRENGPFNWVRCRVVRVLDEARSDKKIYRAVFAFDTKVSNFKGNEYYGPLSDDVRGGSVFRFALKNASSMLTKRSTGHAWVEEWASAVYSHAVNGRIKNRSLFLSPEDLEQNLRDRVHQAHYLNMLSLLGNILQLPCIRLISAKQAMGVSLVLDIGNSRSCGVLMEDTEQGHFKTTSLFLRDLNAPENVYDEAFESCVEFSKPEFDYDGLSARSGREDAFIWPSLVRTGPEAVRLSSMRCGNEGSTGLNSPKRYIWNDEAKKDTEEWRFNPYSYQIPVIDKRSGKMLGYASAAFSGFTPPASLSPVSDYINSKGDALFAADDLGNFHAVYSGKSTMTFMLQEILLQAISQINSCAYRFRTSYKDTPRYLKAVVITTPPSMPDVEREIFRGCAYEAIGILWKCMGYDPAEDPAKFSFTGDQAAEMEYPVPEVVFDWDEAQAAQFVYLYNETQEVFGGNCERFLSFMRRPDADARFDERIKDEDDRKLISCRIASLDIGGGTTDMVITDYSFPENTYEHSETVKSRQILREGFKYAGDDVLLELIEKTVLTQIGRAINELYSDRAMGRKAVDQALSALFGENSSSDGGEQFRAKRLQATQQIFKAVGYRVLSYLEELDKAPASAHSIMLQGTIGAFIEGLEQCSVLQVVPQKHFSYPEPNLSVKNFVKEHLGKYIKDFDIMGFEINLDLKKLNAEFVCNSSRISASLSALSGLVNLYRPDVLLLTGRPSNVSGIRTYFLSRCALPSSRVIRLSHYECGSWYPFTTDGSAIGDTKTTVAVGAALAYIRRSSQALRNFRFDLSLLPAASPVRYFGHIDGANLLRDPFYRFVTEAEFIRSEGGDDTGALCDEMQELSVPRGRDGSEPVYEDIHVLPDNLGFKQFASVDHPASMLYSIERETNAYNIKTVRQAAAYRYFDDEDLSALKKDPQSSFNQMREELRDQCIEAERVYLESIDSIRAQGEFVAFANTLTTELKNKAAAQAAAELKDEEPHGMLAALKRAKFEERKAQRTQEIFALDQAALEEKLCAKEEEIRNRNKALFNDTVRQALGTHYLEQLNYAENNLKKVEQKIRQNVKFAIELKHEQSNEAPCERLKPLWSEIKRDFRVKLPKTFKLKLQKASCEGGTYTAYIKLKLKTVSEADETYWTETGRIYTGGIIPANLSVKQ